MALEQRRCYRPRLGPSPGQKEQSRQLTEARRENDWLSRGSITVQQQALRDLDQAYKQWWSNPGYFRRPGWRSKSRSEGFRIVGSQGARFERLSRHRGIVRIPKVGWVDFRWSRNPTGAKSYRVTLDKAGRWWISFAIIPNPVEGPEDKSSIGIDSGVVNSFTSSEGDFFHTPGLTPSEEQKLLHLQRKLARQQKGSKRQKHTRRSMAKLMQTAKNRRKDYIEKLTTDLSRKYDIIAIENLNISRMTRSARGSKKKPGSGVARKASINRRILGSGWGLLARRLEEKAGERVIRIDPRHTSQTCSLCGHISRSSRESQAVFACRECDHRDNADINAAKNILAAGQAVAARGGYRQKSTKEARTSVRSKNPGWNPFPAEKGGCQSDPQFISKTGCKVPTPAKQQC